MENQGMTGKMAVGGITRIDDLVLVRILGAKRGYGLAGQALSSLGLNGINIICVTSILDREDLNNIGLAIKEDDLDQALGILQSLKDEIEARSIEYQRHCSSVSIYGPHFSERPAIAGTVFEATGAAGVEIHMIATSFSTVSFLTNEKDADAAVAGLRECFLVP
jgi:aspartokinase